MGCHNIAHLVFNAQKPSLQRVYRVGFQVDFPGDASHLFDPVLVHPARISRHISALRFA